jgi:hypothetical protein
MDLEIIASTAEYRVRIQRTRSLLSITCLRLLLVLVLVVGS